MPRPAVHRFAVIAVLAAAIGLSIGIGGSAHPRDGAWAPSGPAAVSVVPAPFGSFEGILRNDADVVGEPVVAGWSAPVRLTLLAMLLGVAAFPTRGLARGRSLHPAPVPPHVPERHTVAERAPPVSRSL